MRGVMIINLICMIWMAICFYFNWEPWLQVAILVPNMIGWTLCSID